MLMKRWCELVWMLFALFAAFSIYIIEDVDFPLYTTIWILISMVIYLTKEVDILRVDSQNRRITMISIISFIVLSWLVMLIVEAYTSTYGELIHLIQAAGSKDIVFHWITLSRTNGNYALFFLFSFIVTIFAQEAFFRGYLLRVLEEKYDEWLANILQAILFCLPHIITGLMFPVLQGFIYIIGYVFLLYGLLSGFFAQKAGNIWPGLIAASTNNLLLTMVYFR